MSTTEAVLQTAPTMSVGAAQPGGLHVSFELSDKNWKLAFGDGRHGVSRCTLAAGDTAALLQRFDKIKARWKLTQEAPVHSCYEAGRDGWWLHRWLLANGIDNIVVDAASIEVNRRARRAKTDRLDADKLLAMLLRHHAGERVWSVLYAPSEEEEDARRLHRELGRLQHEHTAHTNRVSSLLVLHGLRTRHVGGRDWPAWWEQHRQQVPPALRTEIERECERLQLVKTQMRVLHAQQRQALGGEPQSLVARLGQLRCIGLGSAWLLVHEIFGWRHFANRRQLAGCLGLVPTPYASGTMQHEQGISKAGNKRVRALLVELAWCWLRLQPDSALSQWYSRRFAHAGPRMRRVGIVAMARRLAVALWRFLEHGEVPDGATLKPTAPSAA